QRPGNRRLRPGLPARLRASDHQPRIPGSGLQPRLRTQSWAAMGRTGDPLRRERFLGPARFDRAAHGGGDPRMTAPAATRIAVTGVGAVTPAGIGTQALWTT